MVDATSPAWVASAGSVELNEFELELLEGTQICLSRTQRGVLILRAFCRSTADASCHDELCTPKECVDSSPRTEHPTLPSSLRSSSIRSTFYHQGLARLGGSPFRGAVTFDWRSLSVSAARDVPVWRQVLPPVHLE